MPSPAETPRTKPWTREECERLSSMGFFAGQHLELIDGELIDKMGKNSPHTNSVLLLHKWLVSVFEVSDTTLDFDVKKARLYARAGIPDYWVLDVNNRRLIVHREPNAGRYASVLAYGQDEIVAPLAAPQALFRVAAAFEE